MKNCCFKAVKNFLRSHGPFEGPLLLGLSGGPDSTALLHLLIECGAAFHVAHVDYGWKEVEREQALLLREKAAELKIPFHMHSLNEKPKGNWEETGRKERFAFFAKIYASIGASGLLLAHQRDDQVETLLKRLFEGADLASLKAMHTSSSFGEMKVYRPLLQISKDEIFKYLKQKEIPFFDDVLNRDPAFLRSRMRVELFPQLSKIFGKEIGSNIFHLGESIFSLQEYLEKKARPFWKAVEKKEGVVRIDFNPFFPLEEIELNAFLRGWAKKEGVTLSKGQWSTLLSLIQSRAQKKQIIARGGLLEINRGVLGFKTTSML